VITSAAILSLNLSDYSIVWIVYTIIAGVALAFTHLIITETITSENKGEWKWKKVNPFGSFILAFKYRYFIWLLITVFFLALSVISVVILPGYVIQLYNWKPAYAVYLQLASNIFATIAAGVTFKIIPKYGSRFALNIGYVFSVFAFVFFIVSPYSSALAIIGNILLGVSLLKVPAYADELSKNVPTSEQAQIQSSKLRIIFCI
jgi:DHA1 family tetracycline resistance protein-like MFS transporter